MSLELPYRFFRDLPERASQQLWRDFQFILDNINGTTISVDGFGIFGDGSDGTVTFDGTTTVLGFVPSGGVYTLNRDLYPVAMTVTNGATIKTNSYRIFCSASLTIASGGLIHNSGANSSAGSAGVGAPSSNICGQVNLNGGTGGSFGGGVAAVNTTNSLGGAGGAGGSSAAGGIGTGVAGATATAPLATDGGKPRNLWQAISCQQDRAGHYDGGAGGTSGSSAGSPAATGGGGGGGGIVVIIAALLVNSGSIESKGGNGSAATGASGNAGGGGGGGGGGIIVVCGSESTVGTLTVTGGTGAAGRGLGGTGAAGSTGTTYTLNV